MPDPESYDDIVLGSGAGGAEHCLRYAEVVAHDKTSEPDLAAN